MGTAQKLEHLSAREPGSGLVRVVVDTPKGSRNKYKYDEHLGLYRLSKMLPLGLAFPYDFGFIPSTQAVDGDALDVLLLGEEVFMAYNHLEGRHFKPLGRHGPAIAEQLLADGIQHCGDAKGSRHVEQYTAENDYR